jgi:hypothetical protein
MWVAILAIASIIFCISTGYLIVKTKKRMQRMQLGDRLSRVRKFKYEPNLNGALNYLDVLLYDREKEQFHSWSEEKFNDVLHHSLGRFLRNNLKLWDENSKLHKWFNMYSIYHPDDMSAIIMTTYYRRAHNLPEDFRGQCRKYIDFWNAQKG